MLKSKLTICSSLLYHWLRLHQNSKRTLPFDPKNFRAWTGEFLEQSVSADDIDTALFQLKYLNLIAINGQTVQLKKDFHHTRLHVPPLPNLLVKARSGNGRVVGVVMVISLLTLWLGSVAVYHQSANNQIDQPVEMNPFEVLGEKME